MRSSEQHVDHARPICGEYAGVELSPVRNVLDTGRTWRDVPNMDACTVAPTGISGLDDILAGGLARGCLFLLEGNPGTGKTTIALHFLLQGLRTGERGLYVTLS